MTPGEAPLVLHEGRFARFESIAWWQQPVLAAARILVVGAGALGNEVIKNLALLGVGNVVVVDMDTIEESNLSRSVLFREADEGAPKAAVAAAMAKQIYPAMHAYALTKNVLSDVGLGWFRWAQVVVGALDNREARLFVNSVCARVGRPWIDGGIDVLQGIVRGFGPPETACYECTMGEADWRLLNQRRSCSLLARQAARQRSTPTTPTTASVIGALQVQELVKFLHGMDVLMGRGVVFDGAGHNSFLISYPKNPECPWHDTPARIEACADMTSDVPLQRVWTQAEKWLGELDALDLSREIVLHLRCPECDRRDSVFRPAESIPPRLIPCPYCSAERVPEILHSIGRTSELLERTARQIGLPGWDVLWARRNGEIVGVELGGDSGQLLAGESRC